MDDLISRQAAIEILVGVKADNDMQNYDIGFNDAIDFAISTLSVMPPAQQWIPVSEGLPDEDASVLASIKNHSFEVAVGEIDGEVFWIVDGFIPLDDVIAWMPLPEPYKGVE